MDNYNPADAPAPAAAGAPKNDFTPAPPPPTGGYPPGYTFRPAAPKPPVSATKTDRTFALLYFLLAWLFSQLELNFRVNGFALTLWGWCFVGLTLGYRRSSGHDIPRASLPWMLLVLLSAGVPSIGGNRFVAFLNTLFFLAAAAYWVATLNGTRLENTVSELLPLDIISHIFLYPLQNIAAQPQVLKNSRKKSAPSLLLGAITIMLSMPLLLWVAIQLTAADPAFESLLRGLSDSLQFHPAVVLIKLLLALPFSMLLYGFVYGPLHRRYGPKYTAESSRKAYPALRIIPRVMSSTLLCLLAALYALFLVVQVISLTGILSGHTIEVDYAQYARSGFFELCKVATVNLLVLAATHVFTRPHPQKATASFRVLHTILGCQTLLLIGTALGKMGLYIRFYGLTHLRVYTSWFMILLATVFVILIAACWKPIGRVRWLSVLFCVLFMALCYCNVDSIITRHNIHLYTSGQRQSLDVKTLRKCGPSAVPASLELCSTLEYGDPLIMELEKQVLSHSSLEDNLLYQDIAILRAYWVMDDYFNPEES